MQERDGEHHEREHRDDFDDGQHPVAPAAPDIGEGLRPAREAEREDEERVKSANAMFLRSGPRRAPVCPSSSDTISVPHTPPSWIGPNLNDPIRYPSARLANSAISG